MTCPICTAQLKDGARFCPSCGANVIHATTGQLAAGRVLADRYRVVRPIARGGMGAVYLAADTRLDDAQVAVKEMSSVYRPGDTDAFAQAVAEFRREAALLARLSHPNLPRVIDRFDEDGKQFLVMEYVEGQTLRQALFERGGRATLDEARDWATQLCAVLGYLHSQSPPIIYRDLKPTNVMLRPDGRLALIDFGIARFYKPGQAADTAIYGTVGYAAPEQYGEGQTDQRSDIYALGVLLFHILTNFDVASSPFRLPPIGRLRPDIPAPLARLIARATAMEPADRFASVAELSAELRQAFAPAPAQPPTVAPRRRAGLLLWAFGALLALVLALAGGLALGLPRSPTTQPTPASPAPVALNPTGAATPPPTTASQSIGGPAVDPPVDMVAVPAGLFTMGADDDANTAPAHSLNIAAPFFIDHTEITNQAYRACVQAGICRPPQQISSLTHSHYYDNPEFDRYPVVYVTWKDAQTYCAWRGRRLPTEAEWEKAARGDDARLFPWGNQWDDKRVQLSGGDAGTGDMAAVGSFPQNASPYGALDMSGNAWEWTSSRGMAYPYAAGDGREVQSIAGKRVVRGGAWGTSELNARATTRDGQEPDNAFWNRGFRCAADVGPTENSPVVGLPQPPEGMVAVPGGLLHMGTSQAEAQRWASEYGWPPPVNELPQHSVTLSSFFLDRSEVTNERYAAFVEATGRPPPANSFNPNELSIWKEGRYPPELAQHPVVNVSWEDARAYCEWAGKRLPTEAEWEWAAKGPESWLWPWGVALDQARLNTKERGLGTTAPAGSDPSNASWVGALDLGGNVWEWTSSLGLPYPYDQADGRENPQRPGARVIRGGSWIDPASSAHTSGRNQFDPALANVNVGFRCA
ncbi:MAG TPA: SUMF1/EgtB/PvdO family nonheme iron enzyme, partial [Roseiflexaceae bacterium]|nr:SUMF1/EgtB/PvdO family nonheme iron enzyme [Roseiflexaceae bacterium]